MSKPFTYETFLIVTYESVLLRHMKVAQWPIDVLHLGLPLTAILRLTNPAPAEGDDASFKDAYLSIFRDDIPEGITRNSTLVELITVLAKQAQALEEDWAKAQGQ